MMPAVTCVVTRRLHQVVGDVAVEQRTQHALRVERQARLQAEHGVHRHRVRPGRSPQSASCGWSRWRRRDRPAAHGPTLARPPRRARTAARSACRHGGRHVDAKRREVAALEHRQVAGWDGPVAQTVAVVGGIELAAERDVPAAARPPAQGCARLSASTRRRSSGVGRSGIAKPGPDNCSTSRGVSVTCGRLRSMAAGSVTPKRQRIAVVRAAAAGGERRKSHAAVNRKQRPAVVEHRHRVELVGADQCPTQRLAALVGEQARRHDEPDAATGPSDVERALDEQLELVGVPPALPGIDTRVAREAYQRLALAGGGGIAAAPSARSISQGGLPTTASKPPSGSWPPLGVQKHFGELQRPVKAPDRPGPRRGPVRARRRAHVW